MKYARRYKSLPSWECELEGGSTGNRIDKKLIEPDLLCNSCTSSRNVNKSMYAVLRRG